MKRQARRPGARRATPGRRRLHAPGAIPRPRLRPAHPLLSCADVELDPVRSRAWRGGHRLALTPTEFHLLRVLMEADGAVCTREELLEEVWGITFDPRTNLVDVHVTRLRQKLEQDGGSRLIHVSRGVGYSMGRAPSAPTGSDGRSANQGRE